MGGTLTLSELLEKQAHFHLTKERFSTIPRNYEAAERLEALAEQAAAGNFNASILNKLESIRRRHLETGDAAAVQRLQIIQTDILQDVGVRFFPDTVSELLWEWLRRVDAKAVAS
jgi:hypothetical protein